LCSRSWQFPVKMIMSDSWLIFLVFLFFQSHINSVWWRFVRIFMNFKIITSIWWVCCIVLWRTTMCFFPSSISMFPTFLMIWIYRIFNIFF
jgi:hypothetical protein